MIARFLGIGVATSLLAVATAGSAGAAAGSIWHVVPSMNPQAQQVTNSTFASVSLATATDGWAAGQFMDKNAIGHPLVEHWDGSAFSRAAAPTPKGRQAGLAGVDELSTTDAWAVGTSGDGGAGQGNIDDQPLIEHWNGTRWSIVSGPSLPAGATGDLSAIGGTGPDDLWAVGFQLSAEAAQESVLFEHFDGSAWQIVPFPNAIPGLRPERGRLLHRAEGGDRDRTERCVGGGHRGGAEPDRQLHRPLERHDLERRTCPVSGGHKSVGLLR